MFVRISHTAHEGNSFDPDSAACNPITSRAKRTNRHRWNLIATGRQPQIRRCKVTKRKTLLDLGYLQLCFSVGINVPVKQRGALSRVCKEESRSPHLGDINFARCHQTFGSNSFLFAHAFCCRRLLCTYSKPRMSGPVKRVLKCFHPGENLIGKVIRSNFLPLIRLSYASGLISCENPHLRLGELRLSPHRSKGKFSLIGTMSD